MSYAYSYRLFVSSICVVYTWKLYIWLSNLNNVRHSCLTNTNLWNKFRFCTDLEQTHEACKFVMNSSNCFEQINFFFAHKRHDVTLSWNNSCINMWLTQTFHPINNQPMWHGHLKLIFMIEICSYICLCGTIIYD
jgi:hypothetical protein